MDLIQPPIDPSKLENGTWEEYWINSGSPTGNGSYYYEAPSVDINGNSEIYEDNHGIWSESNSGYKGWWWANETDLTYEGINYDGQAVVVIDADQNSIYDSKVDYVLGYAFGWDNGGTSGAWDRTYDYEGIFSGGAFGAFKITVEMDYKGSNRDDTVIGSTKNDNLLGALGNDEIYGYELNDNLYGGHGNDSLYGGTGNDTIDGGLGNDTIDGGYGSDTAVFNYNFSDYTIAQSNSSSKNSYKSSSISTSNSFAVSSNSEGTDTLTGIELAQFADKTIGIDYSNPISGYNYLLTNIKDYGGTLHGGSESEQEINYYYQGSLDVAGDGTIEDIYTNKISKRWATVRRDSSTNNVDWSDHGKGGGTRIVGIYIDPLVTSGDVVQFSDHDSQYRFQNDLGLNNLIVKTTGDYDSDGIQEVYWKTADGSAYLRSLMHADGNIRYANYQSEEQMSNYLTNNGYESVISDIV